MGIYRFSKPTHGTDTEIRTVQRTGHDSLKGLGETGFVASILQGGGSHCVTLRVLTRLSCRNPRCVLLNVTFFRMSVGGGGGAANGVYSTEKY